MSLLIVGVIYYFIIKATIKSIIDPVFLALLGSAFGNTVPVFLYFYGAVSTKFFIYFICIESVFWLAYFLFRKKRIAFSQYEFKNEKPTYSIFKLMLALCIFTNLLTYAALGIPLFQATHTATYSAGGGWGLLLYLNKFSLFYVIVYSFYLFHNKRHVTIAKFSLCLVVLFCLLSGSKSGIIIIVTGYFFYLYYYCHKSFNLRDYKKYVVLVALFPLLVIMSHSSAGINDAFIGVVQRVVAYGDMYWMALPNNVMDYVVVKHPFTYLFQGILGPMRLIDYSILDENIGMQLTDLIYPGLSSTTQFAPNSRLAYLGWTCFGWYGIIFSFIIGAVFSFITTRMYTYFPQGIVSVIVYGFIYNASVSLLGDPTLAIGSVFTIIVFLIVMLLALYLFYGRTIKLKKINRI